MMQLMKMNMEANDRLSTGDFICAQRFKYSRNENIGFIFHRYSIVCDEIFHLKNWMSRVQTKSTKIWSVNA